MKSYNVVAFTIVALFAFAIGLMLFNDANAAVEKKLVLEQVARDMTEVKALVGATYILVRSLILIVIIGAAVGLLGSVWILLKRK